jgi:hypothetical protein
MFLGRESSGRFYLHIIEYPHIHVYDVLESLLMLFIIQW